jgi:uncharacterized protein YndB with AHSA1/START domain
MPHIEGEIVINRPVAEVFDFVADERNEPRYNPRMRHAEKTTAGPIGVGTRFRAEFTSPRRAVATTEITSYEPPSRLASSTHLSGMDIRGTLNFEIVPEGTRMRWSWQLHPHGLLKLLGPLVASIGSRQEKAIWASLKRFLEQQQPSRT